MLTLRLRLRRHMTRRGSSSRSSSNRLLRSPDAVALPIWWSGQSLTLLRGRLVLADLAGGNCILGFSLLSSAVVATRRGGIAGGLSVYWRRRPSWVGAEFAC